MTGRPLVQQAAEWIIRRACQHLGGDARPERHREWAAELPAILNDPEENSAVVRYFRTVSYAAGIYWTARQLRRAAGGAAGDALNIATANAGYGWASRSRRRPLRRPKVPDGVLLAVASVVLWLSLIVVIRVYPPSAAGNDAYATAGVAVVVLSVTALVRFVRWLRRRSSHPRRP